MENKKFGKAERLTSMMKLDLRRVFTGYKALIFMAVCLLMPILILVMTTMMSDDGTQSFTNTWNAVESVSGSSSGMDITSMCNINLVFFLGILFACLFISEDFRSGFSKNLFTVRSTKWDYVTSKVITMTIFGMILLLSYFTGTVLGGAIAGLSFSTEGFGAKGIICCLLSKMFFMGFMMGIATLASVFGKSRTWLSILLSLASGMLIFTMISMTSPLDSTLMNVALCLAGGVLFGGGFASLGALILNKFRIV